MQLSKTCGLSGGVYTQVTDVEDEVNGFYTYDRQVHKMFTKPVRDVNERLSHSGSFGSAPRTRRPARPVSTVSMPGTPTTTTPAGPRRTASMTRI